MKKHIIWSISCCDAVSGESFCVKQFDEDESILEVSEYCLAFESAGCVDPCIHCEVYYTEE